MVDFESNIGLVGAVYNKLFSKYRWIKDDLMQEGSMALFIACQKYDKERNTNFSTFATACIKNSMLLYVKKELRASVNIVSDDVIDYADSEFASYNSDYESIEVKEKFRDVPDKKILHLMVAGFNNREISEQTNNSYRVITKKVNNIKEYCAKCQ